MLRVDLSSLRVHALGVGLSSLIMHVLGVNLKGATAILSWVCECPAFGSELCAYFLSLRLFRLVVRLPMVMFPRCVLSSLTWVLSVFLPSVTGHIVLVLCFTSLWLDDLGMCFLGLLILPARREIVEPEVRVRYVLRPYYHGCVIAELMVVSSASTC